jgi:hypothetical protein
MYQSTAAPQSIGGVLDDGFRLFRASLPKVVLLAFLGTLAGQLPNLMLSSSGAVPEVGTVFMVSVLVSMLVSLMFYGAVIGRMNAVADQGEMSVADALSLGVRRLLPLFAFSLLYGIVLMLGTLLLLIPGIIFGVSLMFGFYVVLLEGEGPLASLKSSHLLVWGNWWRTLVIVSVATVVMMVAYVLVAFIAGFAVAVGGGEMETIVQLLELVLVPLLGAAVAPLFYALLLATYRDLKLRRSGADLEQRLSVPARA